MSSLDEELSEECESEALHSYYQDLNSPEVQQSVRNFDKRFNYDQLCKEVNDGNSKNFLIDYGDNHAYCAFNLSAQCIRDLVKAEVRVLSERKLLCTQASSPLSQSDHLAHKMLAPS